MATLFSSLSYELHASDVASRSDDVPNIIGRPELIDAWNQRLSYAHLEPLVESFPASSWMTVGDGGGEAFFLESAGVEDVTATCISDAALASLRKRGFLRKSRVRAANAENIAADDGAVEFVLCKEAYHHFPRPPLAFYEMLRVCRRAVVLIEPAELAPARLLDRLKVLAKLVLRRRSRDHQLFEESGNFVFRVSLHELIKMATALQLDALAYAYFNDLFILQIASRSQDEPVPMLIQRLGVLLLNALCSLKLMSWGKIAVIAFKEAPDEKTAKALKAKGFTVLKLPRNPYVAAGASGTAHSRIAKPGRGAAVIGGSTPQAGD